MPFLSPNQQLQSTEGKGKGGKQQHKRKKKKGTGKAGTEKTWGCKWI